MRAAREAIGPDAKLFVDAGASDAYWPHGLKWALRTAEMLKDYDVGWFEEALRPDALEDFCELRRASPVPIAGGEVLTRRQAFLPWLARGALDIVQPDVTKVGGISEQRRIAWLADDFGVKYVGHGWNTALGLAADLQLAAAMPLTDLVEFIGGSPYVDDITAEPFVLDREGYLAIPDAPGLGVTLDRDKLARYTPDPALCFHTDAWRKTSAPWNIHDDWPCPDILCFQLAGYLPDGTDDARPILPAKSSRATVLFARPYLAMSREDGTSARCSDNKIGREHHAEIGSVDPCSRPCRLIGCAARFCAAANLLQ